MALEPSNALPAPVGRAQRLYDSHRFASFDLLATLIAVVDDAGAVQFAGPVLPQAGQIERLLKSLGL